MLNIIRWIAVLPGAVICALLSTFPLHWVLYGTLTASGVVEPYPELPERLLTPFAVGLAFVWAGSRIAPSRRVESAAVLFGAWLLLVGAGLALSLTGARIGDSQIHLQWGGLGLAGGMVGAFLGFYLIRREELANVNVRLPV